MNLTTMLRSIKGHIGWHPPLNAEDKAPHPFGITEKIDVIDEQLSMALDFAENIGTQIGSDNLTPKNR